MTQRIKHSQNNLNFETIACEKYMARFLQREKSIMPPVKPGSPSFNLRMKDKSVKQPPVPTYNLNQVSKIRPNIKQQNMPLANNQIPTRNVLQYTDDSALVEVTVKTTNPRQRSRSTTDEKEPWSMILKQQKSCDKVASSFSNFDPLRTLHFLAKELQYQLQAVLPEDNTVHQMITDMQYALKRVPPEVASTIHLQQTLDLLPSRKTSATLNDQRPERLEPKVSEQTTQTSALLHQENNDKLLQVMEESTFKLEESCKQMESLCSQLKNEKEKLKAEKEHLVQQLQAEVDNGLVLKKRIEDLEFENTEIYCPKIKNLEEEKRKLELEVNELSVKLESQCAASTTELRCLLTELKTSKSSIEQECTKLKHQLRLSAIEKEKFVAILAVRDRQINEIRNEMTQLQDVVNDQLMELHNNAFTCLPGHSVSLTGKSSTVWKLDQNKENVGDVGDVTISTLQSNDGTIAQFVGKKPGSFQDIPSGDTAVTNILQEMPENYFEKNDGYIPRVGLSEQKNYNRVPEQQFLDRQDSQASIRSMFSEIKKTAYAVAGTTRNRSQLNFNNNNNIRRD